MFDVVIKNGLVADGVSDAMVKADVAITGDRISAIAPELNENNAARLVDAKGKIVAPGFVDAHSHSDYYLIIDPRARSKIMQGVTTEIGGNCGYSSAPMNGALRRRRALEYKQQFDVDISWSGLDEYFEELDKKKPAVNFCALIGYNTIRGSVLGENSSQPDNEALGKLNAVIAKGLDHGALGMSVGVIYPPACFAGLDELISVFRTVGERDKIFTSHIRSEGAGLLSALEEVVNVSKGSGARLQVSHLKTAGKSNWWKLDKAFGILESARADGARIMADRYPYTASNTGLQVVLPNRAFDGGRDKLVEALKDKAGRESFKNDILKAHPDKEYWDSVMVSQVATERNKDIEGLSVSKGAELRGKDVFDFIFDLLVEENTDVEAIFFCMSEENLERVLSKPWVTIGSDSGARAIDGPLAIGRPHPRTFGSFPKFFAEYVRDKKLFTMPEAVRKTSYETCRFFGLAKRGAIKEGWYADLAILDMDTIGDNSTYADPLAYPGGVEHVFVNGVHCVSDGVPNQRRGGRILTR